MSVNNIKLHIGPYFPNWAKYGNHYYKAIKEVYKYHSLNDFERSIYISNKVLGKVRQAYDQTVFYNNLYKVNNVNPHDFKAIADLDYLPIINKKDIIDSIDNLIINTANKDALISANTGGSTGNPLLLYRSRYEMVQEVAFLDFHLARLFGSYRWLNNKKLILRGNTHKANVVTRLGCNMIVSSQLLSTQNIELVVKQIKAFRPTLIHAYPSSLMKLLDLLQLANEEVNIPYMLTSSEVIAQQQINLATNALKAKYLDLYGNSEHSVLALNRSGAYEFDMSYGYPEFVNKRLLSTKLLDSPMPLIRYDCGDTYLESNVLVDKDYERKLLSIGGRVVEYIYDSLKNKLPVVSLIYGQHYDFFNAVNDFSLVQNVCGKLVIEYIANKELSRNHVLDAQDKIAVITEGKLNVSFTRVDSMRLNNNGKKKFVEKFTEW